MMKWFGSPQILKVLHNPASMGFFSFLIGIGFIIMLLHRPFQKERTLSISIEDVESNIIRAGNKCYKLRAEDTKCEKVSIKE